jgi:hypothetical protein
MAEERSTGEAEMRRVGSMLAAGWSATGSVVRVVGGESFAALYDDCDRSFDVSGVDAGRPHIAHGVATPTRNSQAPQPGGRIARDIQDRPGAGEAVPMASRLAPVRQAVPPVPPLPPNRAELPRWARLVADLLAGSTSTDAWRDHCEAWVLHPRLAAVRAEVAAWGVDDAGFALVFALWLERRARRSGRAAAFGISIDPSVRRVLITERGPSLAINGLQRGLALLDLRLGGPGVEPPPPSRLQRLQRALARALG